MPELPEVEHTKEGLKPLLGHTIQSVFLGHALRDPWPLEFPTQLIGRTLLNLSRRAKYIVMELDDGACLLIHLGMSGKFSIIPFREQQNSNIEPRKKHDHFELIFENGFILRLNDPRRFGTVLYQPPQKTHHRLEHLGVEPLEHHFTASYLWKKARHKSISIKPFIMDQSVVVGVGNIYASEALFLAGIHPKRQAQLISKKKMELLVQAIQQVLQSALEKGGTTLRDYRKPNGEKGDFVHQLHVYGRTGEACHRCGHLIEEITLGQRSSFFCRFCQH